MQRFHLVGAFVFTGALVSLPVFVAAQPGSPTSTGTDATKPTITVPVAEPVGKTEEIEKKSFDPDSPLRILFAGDTHFQWGVRDQQNRRGLLSPVERIRPLFLAADYRVLNLETVIAPEGKSLNHKTYIFRSSPENLSVLKYLGVQELFLGNNHTFDLGKEGLEQTIMHLKAADLGYTGIGKTEREAVAPRIVDIQGIKVAFFSLTMIGNYESFAAGNKPGTAQPSALFFAELQRTRYRAHYIVVGVHWGNEYELFPNNDQRELARRLVREGADAVIGHHPHVPQGTEYIAGRPVIYSLGNFLFGSANYQQTHNLIAVLRIDRKTKRSVGVELHPISGRYRSSGYVIDIPDDDERTSFWEEIYLLCRKLNPVQKMVLEDSLRRMIITP